MADESAKLERMSRKTSSSRIVKATNNPTSEKGQKDRLM